MPEIVKRHPSQKFRYGYFEIHRIRMNQPHTQETEEKERSQVPHALSIIDHLELSVDADMSFRHIRNDEILTYPLSGTVTYQDENQREALSAKKLLLVSTGDGLDYRITVPLVNAELLQFYFMPAVADLEPQIQLYQRPEPINEGEWQLLCGNQASRAPLVTTQNIRFYDIKQTTGNLATLPSDANYQPILYLARGQLRFGDEAIMSGDIVTLAPNEPFQAQIISPIQLVCILVETPLTVSVEGTLSSTSI